MRRGGRLILLLLILLVVAGALIYFVISQPAATTPEVVTQPTQELTQKIVVARIDIPNNTILTDTNTFLTTIDIPESEYNSAAGQYFTSPNDLLNKQSARQITFKDRIRRSDVTDPGLSILIPTAQPDQPRPKAFPVSVNNLSGVVDQIRPGDFVDVLASFDIQRTVIRPGFGENNQIVFKEETQTGHSTKTLIQNVQVLQVLKPAVPEGTPGAQQAAPAAQPQSSGPPAVDANGQPIVGQPTPTSNAASSTGTFVTGDWFLVLAMTDQQSEILKYSTETGTISLALRGRGDTTTDQTLGSTLSILVDQFGLPLPGGPPPEVLSQTDLTPIAATAAPVNTAPTPAATPLR